MRKKYQNVVGRNVPKAKISLFFFKALLFTGGKKGGGRERETDRKRTP